MDGQKRDFEIPRVGAGEEERGDETQLNKK